MKTEDDIGHELATGAIDVDAAVAAFANDEVLVYPAIVLDDATSTWQQVEEAGSGSNVFADLAKAGATPEQMDEVGAQIVRLRDAGQTIPARYPPTTDTPSE